jgi:hypothetical protein
MTPSLLKVVFLSIGAGFLLIWVFEVQRTSLNDSYWLLMLGVSFLLAYQYVNLKARQEQQAAKPTPPKPTSPKKKSNTPNKSAK